MSWKLNSTALIALPILSLLSSCKNWHDEHNHSGEHEHHSEMVCACPMKCEGDKTYDKPGDCPVCGMSLEPVVMDSLVQIASPNKQVLSRQAIVKLQPGTNGKPLKAQGFIDVDQSRNQSVAARFGGRVEKLYVKFNGQFVRQREKIMDIYSPELRTFQEEHLFLLKSGAENSLIEKSRQKLRLLGITENQIIHLENTGRVESTITVFSPYDGYVFFNAQSSAENQSNQSATAMNGMGMQPDKKDEKTFGSSASQIRGGMYVNEGQTLFSVNDLQRVWALVSVPNEFLPLVQENQSVEIISETNPSKILNGRVSLVEQTFEESNQRFARMRVVLPNSDGALKINSLITAHFGLGDSAKLQVPTSAVYKTGLNAYVWVKTGTTDEGTGIFQLRKVMAGANNKGMTIITSGLSPNEEIAAQAGLLTDSETFLNEN